MVDDGAARGFINTTGLHANQTVLYDVYNANAVLAAQLVQLLQQLQCRQLFAVQCNRNALLKGQGDFCWNIRSLQWGNAQLQETFLFIGWLVCRIFQIQTFVRQVPYVLVLRVVGFSCNLQRNVSCLRILDLFFSGLNVPNSPRSDDGHVRSKCTDCQLETNLVVALTGAAVANCVSALCLCNLNQTLTDEWTGEGSTQQIVVLVNSACLYSWPNILFYEFFLNILNIQLRSTGLQCLFLQALQLKVTLTNVSCYRNNLTVVIVLLEPRNNDRSIQTAGIC